MRLLVRVKPAQQNRPCIRAESDSRKIPQNCVWPCFGTSTYIRTDNSSNRRETFRRHQSDSRFNRSNCYLLATGNGLVARVSLVAIGSLFVVSRSARAIALFSLLLPLSGCVQSICVPKISVQVDPISVPILPGDPVFVGPSSNGPIWSPPEVISPGGACGSCCNPSVPLEPFDPFGWLTTGAMGSPKIDPVGWVFGI